MHPADVAKLSELAKSLYQHRLVGSMDDAYEMAKKMMFTEHPGEKMSATTSPKEAREAMPQAAQMVSSVPQAPQKPAPTSVSPAQPTNARLEPQPSPTAQTAHHDRTPRLTELEEEVHGAKLSEERTEHTMEHLGNEIKSLKEQLEANTKEFEEIKECMKDIEELAKQGKEAKKKEEAGIKIAQIADKPMTEFDDKLELGEK